MKKILFGFVLSIALVSCGPKENNTSASASVSAETSQAMTIDTENHGAFVGDSLVKDTIAIKVEEKEMNKK